MDLGYLKEDFLSPLKQRNELLREGSISLFGVLFFVLFCFVLILFIYLFMTVLGLHLCARAPSSRGERGPLFIAVRGPPTIAAPPAAEHRLQTRRPSSRGPRAQSLRDTRDPPRPGLEPASPAPAGKLPTTAPPGKPLFCFFLSVQMFICLERINHTSACG